MHGATTVSEESGMLLTQILCALPFLASHRASRSISAAGSNCRVLDLGEAGVAVELDVPFWIDEEDIDVTITSNSVKVHARSTVEGGTLLDKIAFEDKSEKEKRHDYHGEPVLVFSEDWTG